MLVDICICIQLGFLTWTNQIVIYIVKLYLSTYNCLAAAIQKIAIPIYMHSFCIHSINKGIAIRCCVLHNCVIAYVQSLISSQSLGLYRYPLPLMARCTQLTTVAKEKDCVHLIQPEYCCKSYCTCGMVARSQGGRIQSFQGRGNQPTRKT